MNLEQLSKEELDKESLRVSQMRGEASKIFSNLRNALTDYLYKREIRIARLKLATLMTEHELTGFQELIQVQKAKIHDNDKPAKVQN